MIIGKNIKKIRLDKGMTQSDLAEKSNIKLNQISKIERNESDPKCTTIMKIMQALKCDANSLFRDAQKTTINEHMEILITEIQELPFNEKDVLVNIIEKFIKINNIKKAERLNKNMSVANGVGIEKLNEEEREEVENYYEYLMAIKYEEEREMHERKKKEK